MPDNLISADSDTNRIYIHSGITVTITDSFNGPNGTPDGLTYDGTNLISGDYGTGDKIYIHSGITVTITNSFSSPDIRPRGLTYDGTNLISADSGTNRIYKHSGITSTITDSFASPSGSPHGLTYDGANLISADYGTGKVYIHSGITVTITNSFSSPSITPRGLTYDGTNLISADSSTNRIYKHSGITSTITDSFASPNSKLRGLAYEVAAANQAPTAPTSLQVNGKSTPTGANCVTSTPQFTAIFNDPDAGDQSNAIQIQVGTAEGLSDKWDSGWLADTTTEGNRCSAKNYAGSALSEGTSYWWRCRFRDDDNEAGTWSSWQEFEICSLVTVEEQPGGSVPKRRPFAQDIKQPVRRPVEIE